VAKFHRSLELVHPSVNQVSRTPPKPLPHLHQCNLTNRQFVEQAAHLPHQSASHYPRSAVTSTAIAHKLHVSSSLPEQDLADVVCASIPFYLGDRIKSGRIAPPPKKNRSISSNTRISRPRSSLSDGSSGGWLPASRSTWNIACDEIKLRDG